MPEQSELIRLELGKERYALLYPYLRHGSKRRVEAANRKYLKYSTDTVKVAEGQSIKDAAKGVEVILDIAHADFTEANDLLTLGQVAEWSFGPVTQEVLDTLDEPSVDAILMRIDEVIKASPLPESGGKS
jgi:hypothetical protein